jgi:hypothetical protein
MIHRSIPALRSEQSGFSVPVPTEFSGRNVMSMKMRWSYFVLALVAVVPMYAGAQVKMFEPERVGHWYLSGPMQLWRSGFFGSLRIVGETPGSPDHTTLQLIGRVVWSGG